MLQIIFGKQKKANFLFFLKSSPQFLTQMGDGYDFFTSVLDGVSIQHPFLTNLVLMLVSNLKLPIFSMVPNARDLPLRTYM
jgi:hypothetical protein